MAASVQGAEVSRPHIRACGGRARGEEGRNPSPSGRQGVAFSEPASGSLLGKFRPIFTEMRCDLHLALQELAQDECRGTVFPRNDSSNGSWALTQPCDGLDT